MRMNDIANAKEPYVRRKKINFIKRWVYKVVQEVSRSQGSAMEPIASTDSDINTEESFRFKIHFANGGKIVQVSSYERKTDRVKEKLYVVTEDQDLGEEINKIITMEALRR